MQRFDRSGPPLPTAPPLVPPAPPSPPAPAARRRLSPPIAGPSKPRNVSGLSKVKGQPKPRPIPQKPTPPKPTPTESPRIRIVLGPLNPNVAGPVRVRPPTPPPAASIAPASLPSSSTRPPGLRTEDLPKSRKFHEIAEDSEDEEEDEKEGEEGEEEEVLPTPRLERRVIHHPPCGRCNKAHRSCEISPNGGSCLPCKARKYKCEYAKREPVGGKRGRITQEEYEVEEGSEEELAPPPAKKRATKTKPEPAREKAEPARVKKESKGKKAPKPRVPTRKGKGRAKDLEDEVLEIMEVDEEEEEEEEKERERKSKPKPKPARTYTRQGKSLFQFL